MPKLVTIGEAIIDFMPLKVEGKSNIYQQNPGGGSANVAMQAAILGLDSGFIGKVGNDEFGYFFKQVFKECGVNIDGLLIEDEVHTTLAFVKRDEKGLRKFTFFRDADTKIKYDEINLKLIDECEIFHFGSMSLTSEPSKSAVITAIEYAKDHGKIISFDPNYRPKLWENIEKATTEMKKILTLVDIIKLSEEELKILTDCDQLINGIAKLLSYGIKYVILSQGAKGCVVASKSGIERLPTYDVKIIDTSGAGNSFYGAFLYKVITGTTPFSELTMDNLKNYADFANACGALCGTKMGSVISMPNLEEIIKCMDEVEKLK